MKREISVHEIPYESLIAELSYLVQFLCDSGHERCKAMFGWHWGLDYYPPENNLWESHFPLTELEAEVRRVEDSGLGRLGSDDLYISVPPFDGEFCFCHHAGIHLEFADSSLVSQHFFERWRKARWSPVERAIARPT